MRIGLMDDFTAAKMKPETGEKYLHITEGKELST